MARSPAGDKLNKFSGMHSFRDTVKVFNDMATTTGVETTGVGATVVGPGKQTKTDQLVNHRNAAILLKKIAAFFLLLERQPD